MVRQISLIVAAVLVLTLSGCSELPEMPTTDADRTESSSPEESQEVLQMALAYSHDDTLNPFTAVTEVNGQLTGLLYEGLVSLDETLTPQPALASEIKVEDTRLIATLREGAVFSDGTAVTPEDVVTSFQAAKESPRYRELLINIKSAKVEGDTVVFTLNSPDRNAKACLSFPVVKGTTLTDEPAKGPVGTGLYQLKSAKKGVRLVQNQQRTDTLTFPTISLQHLPNDAARQYGLASGDITYFYDDLSEGDEPHITGANRRVDTNSLVFLGINGEKGKLKEPAVRRALSLLLDRSAATQAVYGQWATASAAPFPAHWKKMAKETVSIDRDLNKANDLLDEAECPPKDGKRLELELIYYADRPERGELMEALRLQAKDGGVIITPVPLDEKEYRNRLKEGKYDLYLGEVRLAADLSLRPLLARGDASFGVAKNSPAAEAYAQYLKKEISLSEFLKDFAEQMPYLPLCWRSGVAGFSRRINAVTPTDSDPYYGIAGWQ